MPKTTQLSIYVVVLIVVIVGADLLFFRHQTLERLLANVGIVLLFIAFYFAYFRDR